MAGINSRDINDLHPTLQRGCRELSRRIKNETGWDMGVNSTFRDHISQDYLYAQGRTRPGNIVTNARGGESLHQYRLTFDIHQNNNPAGAFANAQFFVTAGRIWREMGGSWGGDWTSFPDRPHMEFTNGITLRQLQNGTVMPNTVKMKWENEIPKEPIKDEPIKDEPKGDDYIMYVRFEDVPVWGKDTIKKLMDRELLKGNEKGELNLTESMLRGFIVNDRAGLYK